MKKQETPKCFGFFMDGKDCDGCPYLKNCFKKWKEKGEPRLTRELDLICMVKEEKRCTTCD